MEFSLSLDSCRSADDSFCIYERYMRSFHPSDLTVYEFEQLPGPVADSVIAPEEEIEALAPPLSPRGERSLTAEPESLLDNDSSNKPAGASSDDTTRSDISCRLPKPAIITLVSMENSNNATDGVRVFEPDPVFKLPNNELTFNGTLKHLQKLKPIVDPMAALNKMDFTDSSEIINDQCEASDMPKEPLMLDYELNGAFGAQESDTESCVVESDCTEHSTMKEESWSSVGASKGRESGESLTSCGPPSPDLFSEEEEWSAPHSRLQEFLTQHEAYDRMVLKKMEKTLSGVLPPPSVTTIRTDVNEMLKKYHCFLPLFQPTASENTTNTPSKRASFVNILPEQISEPLQETANEMQSRARKINEDVKKELNVSEEILNSTVTEPPVPLPEMGNEKDAKETPWPDILKCRYHDVHYNICTYSERVERAATRVAQRYVGEETASTVTVFSVGQSPGSAHKRKALRVKMAQNKSPGRRLSHLARRRQIFNAATLAEKSQSGSSKMVLIDKNFFPHRKLTYTSERKSPRVRRTPGPKTPGKKTPGRGSSKKKRRPPTDSETSSRTQPTRESSKRALFQSPENQTKTVEQPKANPRIIKSRRNLFHSPSSEGCSTDSDSFGKRKRDSFDEMSRSYKMHKSMSFGGERAKSSVSSLARRATEVLSGSKPGLNSLQKQKLLWAVSNALRAHGWRMGSPGFKEKAMALAQLTKRLIFLPQHEARSAISPSMSDYMLKLARKYVFSIIQGCSIEECYREEQLCLANESNAKLTGYVSATAYQNMKNQQHTIASSKIKENTCDSITLKSEQPKSANKNILQDKLLNIDSNSGFSMSESAVIFKSNSMPSFKEAAKMRARRQISFDSVDVPPKR